MIETRSTHTSFPTWVYWYDVILRGRKRYIESVGKDREEADRKIIERYGYPHTATLIRHRETQEVIWRAPQPVERAA